MAERLRFPTLLDAFKGECGNTEGKLSLSNAGLNAQDLRQNMTALNAGSGTSSGRISN
jgi:hypothetical protein